jgi:hypothetical protein
LPVSLFGSFGWIAVWPTDGDAGTSSDAGWYHPVRQPNNTDEPAHLFQLISSHNTIPSTSQTLFNISVKQALMHTGGSVSGTSHPQLHIEHKIYVHRVSVSARRHQHIKRGFNKL